MSARCGRHIEPLMGKFPKLQMMFLGGLMMMLSACSLVVTQADYDMDKEKTRKDFVAIRGQLLAHTQILANHGKSLNEFKLQLRDAVSNVEKTVKELKSKPTPVIVSPKLERKKESVGKLVKQNRKSKETRYIRRTYQGLLLSYAGGYDEPRGSRYPYKLKPGTRVAIISGDRRGFTRVEVESGRWEGKKMWVRTRWLAEEVPKRMGGKS